MIRIKRMTAMLAFFATLPIGAQANSNTWFELAEKKGMADHDYYAGDEAEQLTPEDLQRIAATAKQQ